MKQFNISLNSTLKTSLENFSQEAAVHLGVQQVEVDTCVSRATFELSRRLLVSAVPAGGRSHTLLSQVGTETCFKLMFAVD